jgi:hypothetical protein
MSSELCNICNEVDATKACDYCGMILICSNCSEITKTCSYCGDHDIDDNDEENIFDIERMIKTVNSNTPVARRRRQPETSPKPVKVKREDNIKLEDEIEQPSFKFQTYKIDDIISAQVRNRLRVHYGFTDPHAFLNAIWETKSAILGSFNLEILLCDQYSDSDLDIYCSGDGVDRLKTYLPEIYKLTVAQDTKYRDMVDCHLIKHVDTYETPLRRIQFIVLKDIKTLDAHIALSDMTIVQNKFDGKTMYVGHAETLDKRGTVLKYYGPRVLRYFERGFKLQLTMTEEIAQKLF